MLVMLKTVSTASGGPLRCTVLVDPRACPFPPSRVGCTVRLRQEAQRLMADGVWDGTLLDGYALRAPDAVLLVPLPVAGIESGAWQEGPNLPRFLPRETLVSPSSEKVISSDPQSRSVMRTRRCDGQNCTENDAGKKFRDEDPNFDRNSVDDRLATVSHAMAEKMGRMHRSFGGSVDDMFKFSNDLTNEGLASGFDVLADFFRFVCVV